MSAPKRARRDRALAEALAAITVIRARLDQLEQLLEERLAELEEPEPAIEPVAAWRPPETLVGELQYLRLREVKRMTTMSQAVIYKRMAEGKFPRQVKLGSTAVWVLSEVEAWMRERREARRAAEERLSMRASGDV